MSITIDCSVCGSPMYNAGLLVKGIRTSTWDCKCTKGHRFQMVLKLLKLEGGGQ